MYAKVLIKKQTYSQKLTAVIGNATNSHPIWTHNDSKVEENTHTILSILLS